MYKRICHAVFAVCVAAGAAAPLMAQTPDGETPANEGVCDPLKYGATKGLYGLCVAFCEAQDCQPDFSADDPFAGCKPSSPQLLELYDRKKGAGDPDMPCVQPQGCPCWTPEELADLRYPAAGDNFNCVDDFLGLDSWRISIDTSAYETAVSTFNGAFFGIGCSLQDRCDDGDCLGGVPGVSRFLAITPEQHEICKEQVIQSGWDRGFGLFCWPPPPPN